MKNILFIILILQISCNRNENKNFTDNEWKTVEVNSEIKNNINFRKFNDEKEFSILFDTATLQSKTNNIIFLQNEKINLKDTLKKNEMFLINKTCTANFKNSDTLSINIMNSNGFNGDGFKISVFKKKYKITYSYFSDAGPDYQSTTLKFMFSKLILNKNRYKENDSIFGYVEFKSKDEKTYLKPVQYYAKGYFRTKIEKNK
ncbi:MULTISPECIES: hypothetical protein [Chryseobacterium]|uniref:Uncharacterized protein n=1 Tax=Chryseobacterium taihuense TaxID=1141221 RepID=A0A4V6YTI6_9FLAO|nr:MULTISPECIES: hypothetical protein [Chryseobacterium]QQV02572.1 hypothetical protein I6I61_16145 [Chryseobacterium sp. FDAARGOS 1104]VFB04174.1 Uncharacterised protein [Chryseobacterium taihuense]